MPVRHRRSTGVVRAGRRRLAWADTQFADNGIATGTVTKHDLLAGFVAAGGSREGVTVVRVRAECAFAAFSASGIADLGIMVDELAATTPQLDSQANPYQAWMLAYRVFPTTSGATVDFSYPFSLDIRSKRKVQQVQETLWFSWKPNDTGNTSFAARFRVLCALP